MRKLGELSIVVLVGVVGLLICGSTASAVHRMDDWVGQNTNPSNESVGNGTTGGRSLYAPDNNYGIISPTSVGGQIQSKVNFASLAEGDAIDNGEISDADVPYIYLADQDLEGSWNFDTPLSMSGTITFNSPEVTEPNICFCWFNDDGNPSTDGTNHRIGLGISNLSVGQGGAVANKLRIDYGFASSAGNNFPFASDDGTGTNNEANALIPNGSYNFTFDYTPGVGPTGGSMTVTIGSGGTQDGTTGEGFWWRNTTPIPQLPWASDFFEFNRFGLVQRSTGNATQLGKYNVTFSNVTYSGGTDAPEVSGDHNGDGSLDAADYVAWRKDPANFGGDPGGYSAWVAQFGSAPGSGGGAVPEPSSLLLFFCGCAALVLGESYSRRR